MKIPNTPLDEDTVPRSRYDVACAQYTEARKENERLRENLKMAEERVIDLQWDYQKGKAAAQEQIDEDADRWRWFMDKCDQDRRLEILESSEGVVDLIEHHVDKGRCGL